jgi:beta-N-acetylhexosaminidase
LRRGALAVVAIAGVVIVALVGWLFTRSDDAGPTAARGIRSEPSTTTTSTTTAPTTTSCDTAAVVAGWPLEQRVAQLLVVGVEPTDADALLAQYPVGGIFIRTPTAGQLAPDDGAHLASLEAIPPLVTIDEEGGRVQRIPDLVGDIPSARDMALTMSPSQVRALAAGRGRAMRHYGITMDFAPDADVSDQAADDIIGDRSFSNDPAVVTRYAQAFADGLRDAGVIPVFKHFPGHGHAVGDSHLGTTVTPPLSELRQSDLVPYETLLSRGPAVVMVGHLEVPGLTTASEPSSINSAAINGLLRSELGFHGLVITDDLESMGAIALQHSLPDSSIRALQAGATMVLTKTDLQTGAVIDAIVGAVRSGDLSESTVNDDVMQVLHTKGYDPCSP